jgi:hypothetical protein
VTTVREVDQSARTDRACSARGLTTAERETMRVTRDDGPPAPRPVPSGPDDLGRGWLSAALARTPGVTGRVAAVRVRPLGEGLGLLSRIVHVQLTWADGTGPPTVVVKLAAPAGPTRDVAGALDMYGNEVRFYRHLGAATDLAVRCHHASHDPRTDDFALVLADLTGAPVVDQVTGCPPARAAEAVTALADHHARFWDERGLAGVRGLRAVDDPAFITPLARACEASWPAVRARCEAVLPAEVVDLGDGFAGRLPGLAARLARSPRTLTHGDFRVDNMFFGPGSEVAGRVAMCDWQLADRARGGRDLGYFLTQSLDPGVRRDLQDDLVDLYVERLAANGVTGYGRDEAWEDYRVSALFSLLYPVVAGGGLELSGSRAALLTEVILVRAAEAIVDLDCTSLG